MEQPMNGLSIFIYLANVVNNLTPVAVMVCIASIVLTGICLAMRMEQLISEPSSVKHVKGFGTTAIVSGLIAILCPSKETMYLMLGSEVGEELILSDEANKVRDIINQELDTLLDSYIDSEQETLDDREGTI